MASFGTTSFTSRGARDVYVMHVTSAGDNVLSGTKGNSAYVIYGRRLQQGVTEIDLVTTD